MRVFVPVTQAGVEELLEAGGIGPPPIVGFGVTAGLRESYAAGDEEELEHAAMSMAAQACLQLLSTRTAEQVGDRPRRMVLVVDTERVTPEAEETSGGVQVDAVISFRQVAALHADTEDAVGDVKAAVDVIRAGGPRDEDEQFVVDTCEAHDLAWFATQEIRAVL